MKIDFVKGHCGWDVATLLAAEQLPASSLCLPAALEVLSPPIHGGLEVGLLSHAGNGGDIRLQVVDSTSKNWISMCGGITQLIGKALVETELGSWFPIIWSGGGARVRLITDSGVIPIFIEADSEGMVTDVTTTMDSYAAYLYELGIRKVVYQGVPALDVGEFLVIHIEDLCAVYPGVDFTRRDTGEHLDIVNGIIEAYTDGHRPGWAMLYDEKPVAGGDYRLYPRFLDEASASIPYEFQCGTGMVAVILAVVSFHSDNSNRVGTVVFEWGNPSVTKDPFGVRKSIANYKVVDGIVTEVSFGHNVIEIISEGILKINLDKP